MSGTTILPPALPETHYPTKASRPKLTYTEALSRYFVTEQGVKQVATCEAAVFATFIDACLYASPKKPQARQICLEEAGELDYTDLLSRWYIIDLLLSYRFPVTLFSTMEEAMAHYCKACGK